MKKICIGIGVVLVLFKCFLLTHGPVKCINKHSKSGQDSTMCFILEISHKNQSYIISFHNTVERKLACVTAGNVTFQLYYVHCMTY